MSGSQSQMPFSRPFKVEDAREDPIDVEIAADPAECAAVARETGVPEIAALSASFRVEARRQGRFAVTGQVRARLTQICVVTLDPFDSDFVEEVEAAFAPQAEADQAAARYAARPEEEGAEPGEEPPDPIVDGRIDLGALAVEFFVLGLDPYPRKPGVEFDPDLGRSAEPAQSSPFAALARLKDKDPR